MGTGRPGTAALARGLWWRQGRRGGVIAAVVLLGALTSAHRGDAQEPATGIGPVAPFAVNQSSAEEIPTQEATMAAAADHRRRREARERWLAAAEARDSRVRSRRRYRGLSAGESRSLLVETFGELLQGLSASTATLAQQGRFVEFLDDHTARVMTADGPRLVRSWLPLRVPDETGQKQPVDLTLREHRDGFAAVRPLVPVSFPNRLVDPIAVGKAKLPVWVEGAQEISTAGRSGASLLFYRDAHTDTDVVLAPVETGVEVLWHIRSEESPEEFTLRFGLPDGAEMTKREDGAVAIGLGAHTLGTVRAPHVVDAQGELVPATTQIDGDRITFSVKHRAADVAYPLALDPAVEDHRGWYWGDTSGIWQWGFHAPKGKLQGHYNCWWGSPCATTWGLHVFAPDLWYEDWDSGEYIYTVPGQTSFISRAEFNYMAFLWGPQCCASFVGWNGLWDANRSNWASVSMVTSPFWYRQSTVTAGPGARTASFGEASQGAGQRTPHTIHSLASVLMYLDDPESPSTSVTADGAGRWIGNGTISIAATASDPGLGVRRTGLDSSSSLPFDATHRTLPCSGGGSSICPSTAGDAWSVPTATLPEGVTTMTAFAEDAAGKRGTRTLAAKVDRTAPTIALSGSLYDHRDRPLNESETYSLHVRAVEPGCSSDGQRSGVSYIQIEGAGPTAAFPHPTTERCVYEVDLTVRASDLGPGENVISVNSTDHAGNRRQRQLRPIYVGSGARVGEPVEGLAAAAGLGEEDIEAIKSPKPDLLPFWRGDVLPGKGYFGAGFSQPRVAVGGGRVYVAAGAGGVKSFDAADPAGKPVETITSTAAPGGIAHYRDHLYVAGDRRIDVYDPANPQAAPRHIGAGPCRDGSLGEVEGAANQAGCDQTGLGLKRPQGLDAAWGKLFVADEAGASNTRVVRTYASDTGVPLGISPLGDPEPGYRDISVAPDQNLYFDGRRASAWLAGAGVPWLNTGPLLDGHEPGSLPPTGAADADWCDCPSIRGTDWVWGMNWLLATTNNGTRIEEYGPSVRKRAWSPKQTNGTVADLVYHKREERLEASGNLMRHDWLNREQRLIYVASDADIFIAGAQGEHWYEQARDLSYVELLIDGVSHPFSVDGVPSVGNKSTDPAGTLAFDTARVASGTHTLELKAHFTSRAPLSAVNEQLRIDHDLPTGTLDPLPAATNAPIDASGTLGDAHAGPGTWSLQVKGPGTSGTFQTVCTATSADPGTGKWGCRWNTDAYEEGSFQVQARLVDQVRDTHGGPNIRAVGSGIVIVDRTPPSLANFAPSLDQPTYEAVDDNPDVVMWTQSDARAGIATSGISTTTIDVNSAIDGSASGSWTQIGSSAADGEADFEWDSGSFASGLHRFRATSNDRAGNRTQSEWQAILSNARPHAPDQCPGCARWYAGVWAGHESRRYPSFFSWGVKGQLKTPAEAPVIEAPVQYAGADRPTYQASSTWVGVGLNGRIAGWYQGGLVSAENCAPNPQPGAAGAWYRYLEWKEGGPKQKRIYRFQCYPRDTPSPAGGLNTFKIVLDASHRAKGHINSRLEVFSEEPRPNGYWISKYGHRNTTARGETTRNGRLMLGFMSQLGWRPTGATTSWTAFDAGNYVFDNYFDDGASAENQPYHIISTPSDDRFCVAGPRPKTCSP